MLLSMLILLVSICCTNFGSKQAATKGSAEYRPTETSPHTRSEKLSIKNTEGVVVLNKFGKGNFVRIYNADGSVWYEFSYFYDDSDGKFDYANEEFRPFAFHPDYFLLVLKCTNRDGSSLEVIVNEDTGLKKYVKADDPVVKLEPWDKFVLSVFAVTFDQKANPILQAPNGQPNTVAIPTDAHFRPVETNGDWLKINWDDSAKPKGMLKPNGGGWIRWKNAGKLLVDFSYFA